MSHFPPALAALSPKRSQHRALRVVDSATVDPERRPLSLGYLMPLSSAFGNDLLASSICTINIY